VSGIAVRPQGPSAPETFVSDLLANRVLAITEDVIVRWKAMAVEGQKRGYTFGQPDLFIAAIAVQNLATGRISLSGIIDVFGFVPPKTACQ
jgi:predicted nucleic acid-binding protein